MLSVRAESCLFLYSRHGIALAAGEHTLLSATTLKCTGFAHRCAAPLSTSKTSSTIGSRRSPLSIADEVQHARYRGPGIATGQGILESQGPRRSGLPLPPDLCLHRPRYPHLAAIEACRGISGAFSRVRGAGSPIQCTPWPSLLASGAHWQAINGWHRAWWGAYRGCATRRLSLPRARAYPARGRQDSAGGTHGQ